MNISDNTTVQSIKLAKILTYLGALPFLFAAFLSLIQFINLTDFFGVSAALSGYKAKILMHTYAVVILSFLAGIQWSFSLNNPNSLRFLLISNVLALSAWFSLVALASKIALTILLMGFICALLMDFMAHKNQFIPDWFWQLRKKISVIVCAAILTVLLTT